jgi:hypothetical protein
VYPPKRVFQELEAEKEEYIWATFGVSKNHKIKKPKIVEPQCPIRNTKNKMLLHEWIVVPLF